MVSEDNLFSKAKLRYLVPSTQLWWFKLTKALQTEPKKGALR